MYCTPQKEDGILGKPAFTLEVSYTSGIEIQGRNKTKQKTDGLWEIWGKTGRNGHRKLCESPSILLALNLYQREEESQERKWRVCVCVCVYITYIRKVGVGEAKRKEDD